MTKNINIDPNDDENNNGGVDEDDERFLAGPWRTQSHWFVFYIV